MMPTKPMGPPTETAAPVASEAAKNATRCARTTLTPRVPAASALMLSRFSGRASQANPAKATSTSGSAASDRAVAGDVEIAHEPPQGAKRLREVAEVLHEQNERREERVERDAREQQHRRRHPAMLRRWPARRRRARRGARRAGSPSATPPTAQPAPNVMAIIAPSDGAGRDAERVRRGQRVAEQSLEHDAGGGERAADERGRQRARQPRDEEDLRVHVVGERHRSAEHAAELDRRRSDERRREHGHHHRQEAATRTTKTSAFIR